MDERTVEIEVYSMAETSNGRDEVVVVITHDH